MSSSLATPCSVAHQAPLTMGFPRQEYWSGLLFPSQGDLPDPRIKPVCPTLAGGSCAKLRPANYEKERIDKFFYWTVVRHISSFKNICIYFTEL